LQNIGTDILQAYNHQFVCQTNILTKTVASAVISQNAECLFQYEQKCWKQYGVSIFLSACWFTTCKLVLVMIHI